MNKELASVFRSRHSWPSSVLMKHFEIISVSDILADGGDSAVISLGWRMMSYLHEIMNLQVMLIIAFIIKNT